MKTISLLGSTGFIGTSTLKIVSALSDCYNVVAMTGGKNVGLLSEQVKTFKPEVVSVVDQAAAEKVVEQAPAGADGQCPGHRPESRQGVSANP